MAPLHDLIIAGFGLGFLRFGHLGAQKKSGLSIQFAPAYIKASATIGTVVGTAFLSGTFTGTPAWTLTNSAGGKYAISGGPGVVTVAAALAAGTDTIAINETGTVPLPPTDPKSFQIIVLAPANLTSPLGTPLSFSTALLTVNTDEGIGTLFWTVDQSATPPSAAQIILGQDHLGAAAVSAGSQTVTATGAQSASTTVLTQHQTYFVHFMQSDPAGNQSTVVTSASFTQPEIAPILSSPLGTGTGPSTASLSVSTTEADGTLWWVVSVSSATPSIAQMKAGQSASGAPGAASGNQAVSSSGAQAASATGLTPSTSYFVFFLHENTTGNDSNIAGSPTFSTTGGGVALKSDLSNPNANEAWVFW